MATSSITKQFVIRDEKACDKLINALNKKRRKKPVTSNKYDEGKKLLAQYYSH